LQENWHALTIEETYKKIGTSLEGLTNHQVKERIQQFGPNELSSKKKRNLFLLFLDQFKSPLIYILFLAAIITYFLRHTVDTWVILAVVLFNAFFGFLHEFKAEKAMEALSKIVGLKSKVKRDGVLFDLASGEIVPGDVVEIIAGNKISADIRIIEQQDLMIDESVLTGESLPQQKSEEALPVETTLGDRANMLYSGTVVISGRGWGVVAETGMRTKFGKITREVSETQETKTPMQHRMADFSKKYLVVVLVAVFLIFIVGIAKKLEILQMFLTAL